ncbi:MAG: hypothetical protein Q7S11_02770 [bacterium]|nr:hypothetical protein [bacterium]
MDIKDHTHSDKLERYSFVWSEVRLIIAAVALFLGGVPPVLKFFPVSGFYGPVSSLLNLCWIISGIAAGYLLYRWYIGHQVVFGGKDTKDTVAFFVSVVSGLNLGIAGLLGKNIGMSISSNKIIFILVGLLYLAAAYHLYTRWKTRGEKVF